MGEFVFYNGKKLRKGYTTGSCATAAASAAAYFLFTIKLTKKSKLSFQIKKKIMIPIHSIEVKKDGCQAFVVKDGGDDVDATDGMLIGVEVTRNTTNQLIIEGE